MNINEAPTIIKFNNINVNLIYTNSSINIGKNIMINWSSCAKDNYGLGEVAGSENLVLFANNFVIDPDFIDNPNIIR